MSDEPTHERAEEVANLLVRVYEMHETIIAETGGLPGLRDAALLHSAVARPFATFAGKELYESDFEKAAALFHSLIKSHPFMDGTKRTAFAAALYFLENCGYPLPEQFPITEVVEFCVAIAEENLRQSRGELVTPRSIAEIAEWFRRLLGLSEN
ncbi:MAG: type II toxin-antitoxin system death-on-curing family toxin [candidate division KSB1 bacterium]|nr:type II toxin-antitoxin system death-on-curing family toxin [candidate division KSB1 bacterium]MDZ7301986.1 type II toxin-antitoxin system death-on-curing family toxin [candidate division KSB1 bacterium]MDZ7310168.1 type II toxin-antitoxin system death-on-curing family toxin [candidate division KSB1 bacterium]